MKRVSKFLRLSSADQLLLLKAAFLLGTIRLGLRLLSFQTMLSLLARMAKATPELHHIDQAPADKVPWAVGVAKCYIPGVTTCLAQAFAVKALLNRRGCQARLRIGVDRGGEGQFQAHAWVESQGRVVVGAKGLSRYTPLPHFEG